jgi:pimeloyl-ACP methyl ester carboxylesterase
LPQENLPNGVLLHWREAGNPTGAPVVWIHGGSVEDSSMMVGDLEPFFGAIRGIFPDARGHGLSQKFERIEDYTYAKKGEDMLLLLDSLGVDSAIWGGASMGGALSLWAAVHAPTRVRAVISISGPPYAPPESDVQWWAEHRALVEQGRFAEYFDANIRLRLGGEALSRLKARPERYAETIERLHAHSVASFLALLDETYCRSDWLDDCVRISCPVLVISGSDDHFPSLEQSRRVAQAIAGARFHVVKGGGHFPNRTHRSEVQQVIGAFLEEVMIVP